MRTIIVVFFIAIALSACTKSIVTRDNKQINITDELTSEYLDKCNQGYYDYCEYFASSLIIEGNNPAYSFPYYYRYFTNTGKQLNIKYMVSAVFAIEQSLVPLNELERLKYDVLNAYIDNNFDTNSFSTSAPDMYMNSNFELAFYPENFGHYAEIILGSHPVNTEDYVKLLQNRCFEYATNSILYSDGLSFNSCRKAFINGGASAISELFDRNESHSIGTYPGGHELIKYYLSISGNVPDNIGEAAQSACFNGYFCDLAEKLGKFADMSGINIRKEKFDDEIEDDLRQLAESREDNKNEIMKWVNLRIQSDREHAIRMAQHDVEMRNIAIQGLAQITNTMVQGQQNLYNTRMMIADAKFAQAVEIERKGNEAKLAAAEKVRVQQEIEARNIENSRKIEEARILNEQKIARQEQEAKLKQQQSALNKQQADAQTPQKKAGEPNEKKTHQADLIAEYGPYGNKSVLTVGSIRDFDNNDSKSENRVPTNNNQRKREREPVDNYSFFEKDPCPVDKENCFQFSIRNNNQYTNLRIISAQMYKKVNASDVLSYANYGHVIYPQQKIAFGQCYRDSESEKMNRQYECWVNFKVGYEDGGN